MWQRAICNFKMHSSGRTAVLLLMRAGDGTIIREPACLEGVCGRRERSNDTMI
jgi:hypothetical protein